MQILLASAKIMNDRSATKGDACQSKKVSVLPDVTLSIPAFRKEAESFARDMAQYSTETIAEMLGCSHQIAAQNRLRFMRFFEDMDDVPCPIDGLIVIPVSDTVEKARTRDESYPGN